MFAFFPSSQLSLLNSNAFRNSFPRSKLRCRRRIRIFILDKYVALLLNLRMIEWLLSQQDQPSVNPLCGAATFGERLSLAANSISKNITRPLVALRFEGAFHFWRVNSFCEEKEPCAPLRLLQGFYSLTSQKYHFFGVDIARLFFIFYPQKNITIFSSR